MNKLGIMKIFYKILNLIILGILLLTFILYISMEKMNEQTINDIKETFQVSTNDNDIHTAFFDLSYNYSKITESEKSQITQPPLDEVILDIGGAFGDFDASRIPWDAENRTYTPGQVLWGIVSQQASTVLFNKLHSVNQMSDIGKLPFNTEKNKFTHESPLFQTSATTEEEAKHLEVAEQVTNLAYPILAEALARGELLDTFKAGAQLVGGIVKGIVKLGVGAAVESAGLVFLMLNVLSRGRVQKAATQGVRLTGVATKEVGKHSLKTLDTVSKAGSKLGNATKHITTVAKIMKQKASTAVIKAISKLIGKAMAKFILKVTVGFAITLVSLSAIPIIGPTLDAIYMITVMPLMMALQMSGVIDGALSKSADAEGCCPTGSVPLSDVLSGDAGEMIISNIPIIGDILSCFFPYMCSVTGTGALVYKKTLTAPKWLGYNWLSCFYLEWPEYNCRIGGVSAVNGKTFTGSGFDWNNGLGVSGQYTNLTSLAANPQDFYQTIRKFVNGKKDDSEKQYVVPLGQNFFYADFSESKMLIDMAKFYYSWASKTPIPNNDGTVTIEYIRKINYVIASSLYTCDVMCEMAAITYDSVTGENYSETVTFDRDRRFYYACNHSNNPPDHWEDYGTSPPPVRNQGWRTLDDRYDLTIRDLNSCIHEPQFNNTKLDGSLLQTAYMQMLDASNRYVFISNVTMKKFSNNLIPASNLPTIVQNDSDVKDFYNAYINSSNNINTLLSTYLTNGVAIVNKTQIFNKLNAIDTASNAILNYRYINPSSPSYPTNNVLQNNQYKLVGCTNTDGTGPCAINPDVTYLETESRYRCNFDVTPYIIRCNNINISISKCIDASNIELVLYNYLLQFPTQRVKTINSIKAKGVNTCEFVWDEVTMDPVTKLETNLKTNVNTQILYQQDLSSCTFHIPPPTLVGSTSNYLFGSQTGGTTGLTTTTSLKNYKNPVLTGQPNYPIYTTLEYKQAKFKYPVFTPSNTLPTSFVESNVDYVPRYDPATFTPMKDLVRPKKPIRIFYPGNDESNLGNYSNNYCGNSNMLQRFVLSYNGDSNNTNKILKIIRTFTSSSNTCDMEVDKLYKDTNLLKRETMTMNMIEGFQSHPFRYESVNSTGKGLNIDKNTDTLSNPYQEGVSFGDPYLRSFQTDILPFTSYFNDDLIKNFTNKTKSLRDNTNRMLVGLTGTRHLGGPSCSTRCQDGEVVQRIIEQYNKDGVASTNVEAEQNSAKQVLNSATNSSNTCHVLLENKKEIFGNLYSPDRSINNYTTENRLAFKSVEMADAGNCTFYPVPNQIYQDISASDLALSSSSNFNTYITPKRICPESKVNCGNSDLYGPAMRDYIAKTGNTINQSNKYVAIGTNKCDYLINTSIRLNNGTLGLNEDTDGNDINYVLRVSYDTPLYSNSSLQYCAQDPNYVYRYTPDNFVLQTPADLSDVVNNPEYYETIDSNASIASPLLGNIDDIPEPFLHNL